MPKVKTITICSSASFYRQAIDIQNQLRSQGFKVKIPIIAEKMKKARDFDVDHYKTWFKNPKDYKIKTKLMRHHFRKVDECDAILVLNYEKRGIPGYIGGNVLMEMALAFLVKKPIYILNPISEDLNIKEEILGLNPKFLNGDLRKLR
jgi:hypothetical protein